MRTVWSLFVRSLVVAACVFLTFRSTHIALADLRAQQDGLDGLDAAIRMEPGDSVLLAREALAKNANGDMSAEEDRELLHAAALNPYDASVQIALGLREEFRGHLAEAERYLLHAEDIDHTFKPAWTLANFYVRQDQADKMWPVVKRGLALNPLVFDPKPVFDLCWNQSDDSKKILDLVPTRGGVPVLYLAYLISTKRADVALQAWPRARDAENKSDPIYAEAAMRLPEFLEVENRVTDAVNIWNQLVDRGIVASGRLDPGSMYIADPDFGFPLLERGFGWRITHETGVAVAKAAMSLRFEFDGNEPESLALMSAYVPLAPGQSYRLTWKTDAAELASRRDPGFAWQIVQQPGNVIIACPPLLRDGDEGVCNFKSVPNAGQSQLDLIYRRATGTTRAEGMLRIANVTLGLGS